MRISNILSTSHQYGQQFNNRQQRHPREMPTQLDSVHQITLQEDSQASACDLDQQRYNDQESRPYQRHEEMHVSDQNNQHVPQQNLAPPTITPFLLQTMNMSPKLILNPIIPLDAALGRNKVT